MNRVLLMSALVAAVFVVPLAARAEGPAAPSAEELKKVIDYYNNGKDSGPILAELKPCITVDTKKGSPTQWDCTEPVSGKVKKGTPVNAWMNFLVPKEAKYEDLSVQWILDGQVRTTQDLSLKNSAVGARTYLVSTISKPGKWEIKVMQGAKELGSAKFEAE
ncbi:MAG TPA: DUF2914 domain-containing protein [Myxococcales bacterium]